MSESTLNFSSTMCSKLRTANVLTLVQLLLLLFVGTCFANITVIPDLHNSHIKNVSVNFILTNPSIVNSTTTEKTQTVQTQPSTAPLLIRKLYTGKTPVSTPSTKNTEKITTSAVSTKQFKNNIALVSRGSGKIQDKLGAIDCELPILPKESRLWRGNETHELNLPVTMTEECLTPGGVAPTSGGGDDDCPPVIVSWEGTADIQSGDILIVRIADSALLDSSTPVSLQKASNGNMTQYSDGERVHRAPPQPAVYQVTRQGHEHCDVTDGMLLDIAPLAENGDKLITLYDKDLTEGVNLLIVVSDNWGSQCVRLKVTVKSDNCGDSQDCSGKGVCYTNISMEGYECQCCPGYIGPHCEEQDPCNPSSCLNDGICVGLTQPNTGSNYQCLCPFGYTGKHCEVESNPCISSPCHNGGTCMPGQNGTTFQCTCANGWSGLNCERSLIHGACASQPCINGICIEQIQSDGAPNIEEYRCFCQPGYAGTRCEYEYNECESSPCANGGTCTDRVGEFQCACGRGYTGRTCQLKVDLCSPNPCPPQRFCMDRGNSYACECPRGFRGDECEEPDPSKTTCDNNPCAHGGTCWSGVDSFYCACRAGYTGKLCEEDFILETVMGEGEAPIRTEQHSGGAVREVRLPLGLYHDRLHNVYIAAGTLGAAIAIVGIVVTACHCRVNKTYNRFMSRMSRVTEVGPPHHWLQDKRTAPPIPPTNPPYPPSALDTTDMYYTLDFSDNQNSPLIQ